MSHYFTALFLLLIPHAHEEMQDCLQDSGYTKCKLSQIVVPRTPVPSRSISVTNHEVYLQPPSRWPSINIAVHSFVVAIPNHGPPHARPNLLNSDNHPRHTHRPSCSLTNIHELPPTRSNPRLLIQILSSDREDPSFLHIPRISQTHGTQLNILQIDAQCNARDYRDRVFDF